MGGTLGSGTITTAAEALRDEEVQRTRVFIRLGWVASGVGLLCVPTVHGDPTVAALFVVALIVGFVVSGIYHQRFRDPDKYDARALFVLGVMCAINTHVAILYFGALTAASVFIVIGLYFVGRSELSARWAVYVTSALCHGAIAVALIAGAHDPGVFATARQLDAGAYAMGALYVQGMYLLAYYTGVRQRELSLTAIEQVQRATRIGSQRAALIDELRDDLARAQRGGIGFYSEKEIGGFQLGAVIGRGSYGEIYEATMPGTNEAVAVKVLHRDQLVDPTQVSRFLREARVTAEVGSSHVVRIIAASEPSDPVPYIAMERLRGGSLAELLRVKGQLTRSELIALVTQIGDGLDAVHARGIIHRDVKPQNLFLDGLTWKIVDFGIARLSENAGTLTRGAIVGTPHYMAPEQAQGVAVGPRADLYSLGAIAYRTLTGRNAFVGQDPTSILWGVVNAMPIRPSALVDVVPDVDRWVALALAKKADDRFASGKALANALIAALRGELPQPQRDLANRLIANLPWSEAT